MHADASEPLTIFCCWVAVRGSVSLRGLVALWSIGGAGGTRRSYSPVSSPESSSSGTPGVRAFASSASLLISASFFA